MERTLDLSGAELEVKFNGPAGDRPRCAFLKP